MDRSLSGKLRNSEETHTKKTFNKFRGEKPKPNREPWAVWSDCTPPSQGNMHTYIHCTHVCTHKLHILTCAYTPKGFHTHADVPSEAEHFTVCKEL